jgi:hypothetical protein
MLVQLDRLVKEFIVPMEKQINSEHEEKKQVPEKETQEIIVGQKRRSRTCTGKSSTSTSASKEMVAAGGTRRSKRVKVDPTSYDPVVEEESWTSSPHVSSGILVTRNITLTASPPLENSSATTDEIMVHGSNEDANPGSFEGVSALAAATRVHKGKCHLMSARTLWHLKQSVGTAMWLEQTQETINTILWGIGAIILGNATKLSKREEYRNIDCPRLTLSALRMQDLSGIFLRKFLSMSTWRIL